MSLDPAIFFEKVFLLVTADFWAALPGRVFILADSLRPYSTVISLLFLTGIVYCFLRIEQLVAETKHYDISPGGGYHNVASPSLSVENPIASRWTGVMKHLDSERENDWRLAILEADVLLDEMVTIMGYRGDSLGEKLKGVEKSDFTTLDKAWEAHAVRNKIAHEGAAFALSEREAKRVIGLYEEVLREFQYI